MGRRLWKWIAQLFKHHMDARQQSKLIESELLKYGFDVWVERRLDARRTGFESRPIILPKNWKYQSLCKCQPEYSRNNSKYTNSANSQTQSVILSGAS